MSEFAAAANDHHQCLPICTLIIITSSRWRLGDQVGLSVILSFHVQDYCKSDLLLLVCVSFTIIGQP